MARAETEAPNKLKKQHDAPQGSREKFSAELDQFEARLEELRMQYEQHFVDILPQAPEPLRKELVRTVRHLLRAPFKNSQTRFRLRSLVHRFQTYSTYWERVLKEREEGRYLRDLFKGDMRDKQLDDAKRETTKVGQAERGLKQLYNTYEEALKKTGASTTNVNFESFRQSLMERAKQMKEQHGVKKLHYKVQIKDGRVILKASPKK